MEYACMVWSTYTKKNIQILKAVQRRAARFVKNDYSNFSSVMAMMQDLERPTLEERKWVTKVTFYHGAWADQRLPPVLQIVCYPVNNWL